MSHPIGDVIHTLPKAIFDRIEALAGERDAASLDAAYEQTRRQLAEENAAKELEFRRSMERDWVIARGEITRLQSERDRLRAALATYGRHLGHCAAGAYPGPSPCTCGLAEALKGAE